MKSNNLYPLAKTAEFRLKLYSKDFFKFKDFYENTLRYPIINSWDNAEHKGVMFDTGVAVREMLTPGEEYLPIQGANISLQVKNVKVSWEKLKDHPNIAQPLELRSWGDMSFRILDPEEFRISFFTTKKT